MQVATNPGLLLEPLEKYYQDLGLPMDSFLDNSEIVEKITKYARGAIPSKFVAVRNMLNSIISANGKAVVWAVFIKNIEKLSSYLTESGIPNRMLYGATPIEDQNSESATETRESIVREFNRNDSSFSVIVANPFAVAESISLHRVCHTAIYLERTFNAAHFIQSKDRIHRYGLGPDDETNYYYILSNTNTDRVIHRRLAEKEARMLEIIERDEIPLFERARLVADPDDIDELIRGYLASSR